MSIERRIKATMSNKGNHFTHKSQESGPQPEDVVIVGGARTPFGKLNGQLAALSAAELGSRAVAGALEKSGVSPGLVDAVIMGQVVQAGAGQNPAKQTAIGAGIGWDVPAVTVNKVCLSGLTAVIDAARLIRSGEARIVVAGGQESMSNGPHLLPGSRQGWSYGNREFVDSVANDGLTDAHSKEGMGPLTERGNILLQVSREEQDEVAAASHRRAAQATENGSFKDEIVPVTLPQRKGAPIVVLADEGIRADTTPNSLRGLRPAFAPDGSITAGNSSQLSDGAAALILTTRGNAERLALEVIAVVGAPGQVAGPDNSLHSQPSNAIKAAMARAGWVREDLDFVEINEAFGAVAVQSLKDLRIPLDRCNIHGGAIALGHPIGASGARLGPSRR
jgi:acetyl-CoA C-acetyltransferase